MQVSPLSRLPVSYIASIPGDTTLYFVQAVLRDTQSSTVLQTLDLTRVSSTPNRYTGIFNSVSDPSGLGRQIDITISVYTDAGYTALSSNYQVLQLNYTVLQPWLPTLGSGGGLNIDYEKLQKMFDGTRVSNAELLNESLRPNKVPELDYDRIESSSKTQYEANKREIVAEVANMLQPMLSAIEGHRQSTETNHKMIGDRLEQLPNLISSIEQIVQTHNATSITERKSLRRELLAALDELGSSAKEMHESSSKSGTKAMQEAVETIQSYLDSNLSEKEIKMVYSVAPDRKNGQEERRGYTPDDVRRMLST